MQQEIKNMYKLKNDIKIFNWENVEITRDELESLIILVNKKLNNIDITFDIGYRYFRNNRLKITPGVFVPQYDTEQIIDLVLEKKIINGNALEIGSGSGAISISLSKETKLNIVSLDVNLKAIDLSKENDKDKKIKFLHQDFNTFETKDKFDLLISNPPYIDKNDVFVEQWVLDNQPKEALFAEDSGLKMYKTIFKKAKTLLKKNGYIILEIGYSQAKQIKQLAINDFKNIEIVKDYAGHDRFMVMKYE